MIDTSKYEGKVPWPLMNAIDDLKAEVKRLREQLIEAEYWVRVEGGHIFETSEDRLKHYKEYIGED